MFGIKVSLFRWVVALGALTAGCAAQVDANQSYVLVTADNWLVDDVGGVATLSVQVTDAEGKPGTGTVRLVTEAGTFGTAGNNILLTLADGKASTSYSCATSADPACAQGYAYVQAQWRTVGGLARMFVGEKGRQLMTNPTPQSNTDGGTSTGGGTGTGSGNVTGSDVLNTGNVYLFGTLEEGTAYPAVCAFDTPKAEFVGFPDENLLTQPMIRPSDGRVVYAGATSGKLYAVAKDEMTWSSADRVLKYPTKGNDNDEVLSTPNCTAGSSIGGANSVNFFPDTGELIYGCGGWYDVSHHYYNSKGEQAIPPGYIIVALGNGGYKLVRGADFGSTGGQSTLVVLTPDNEFIPVASTTLGRNLVSARARPGGGFRVVATNDTGTSVSLFEVGTDGVVTTVGAFADIPADLAAYLTSATLDGEGTHIYIFGERTANRIPDIIIRCPLAPGACDVVYDEALVGQNDLSKSGSDLGVLVHNSFLLTGP